MRKFSRYALPAVTFAGALLVSAAAFAQGSGDGGPHPNWHWQHGQRPAGGQNVPGGQGHVWQHPQGGNSMQGNWQPHQFHGGDVNHFDDHDRDLWRSGRWHHGHFHDHDGWWWFAGGGWYFYPQPIYPFPAYVSTDVIYDYRDDDYYGGYGYRDQGPGPVWYYCNDPKGYYPYVRSCNGKWEPVPATPPDMQNQSGPADQGPPPDGYGDDRNGPQDMNGPPQGPDDNGPPPDSQDSNGPPQDMHGDNGPPTDNPPPQPH